MRRQTLWGTRLPLELVEQAGKGSETTMPWLDGPGRPSLAAAVSATSTASGAAARSRRQASPACMLAGSAAQRSTVSAAARPPVDKEKCAPRGGAGPDRRLPARLPEPAAGAEGRAEGAAGWARASAAGGPPPDMLAKGEGAAGQRGRACGGGQ